MQRTTSRGRPQDIYKAEPRRPLTRNERRTQRQKAFDEVVGWRIMMRRRKLGLSQTRLAELVGASRTAVHRWEAGERSMPAWQLREIATALVLEYDDLFASDADDPDLLRPCAR